MLVAILLSLFGAYAVFGFARAQSAGQTITSPTGKELFAVEGNGSTGATLAYMSSSSLRDGRFYIYNAPLTGFTVAPTVDQSAISLNPAGTIAAGTITMPATTVDGKVVTVFTSATITALTLTPQGSTTFVPAAVITLAAGASVGYVYDKPNNQWHRYQ